MQEKQEDELNRWKGSDEAEDESLFTVSRVLIALLPLLIVVGIRLAGPLDLDDNDQAKTALYVVDVMENGHWVVPNYSGDRPATKPPLVTWLGVLFSLPFGEATELGARMPSVLGVLFTGLFIFLLGAQMFGTRVGWVATWMFSTFHTVVNLSIHVRPDMVMTLCITASMYSLYRLYTGRDWYHRGLFWFWLSLSILAKGPVGVVVVGGASLLLLAWRDWRSVLGSLFSTYGLFWLLLPVAWFLGSLWTEPDFADTVYRELIARIFALGERKGGGQMFGYLFGHFLSKAFPWTLLALAGTATLLYSSETPRGSRKRMFVFLSAWMLCGLFLMSLSAGQRQDYILPFLVPAALLAAAVLLNRERVSTWIWTGVLTLGGLAGMVYGVPALVQHDFGADFLSMPVHHLGMISAGVLLVGACCMGIALITVRTPFRSIMAGILGFLLFHGVYTWHLSPVARAGRKDHIQTFVNTVRQTRRPGDRLEYAGYLKYSIPFYLQENKPYRSGEKMVEIARGRTKTDGRLLVICSGQNCDEIREVFRSGDVRYEEMNRVPIPVEDEDGQTRPLELLSVPASGEAE